jgi:Carbon storage regulator (could also regulate swarming and quorum sensing)
MALYLQRCKGEIINIDDDIEISVTSIEGNVVTLGISAPRHRQVWRHEVYVAKKNGIPKEVLVDRQPMTSRFRKLMGISTERLNKMVKVVSPCDIKE